tara:strand:- start:333 stop:512 length:180 start_codon:yes stop_codon:yes gene_type:complete
MVLLVVLVLMQLKLYTNTKETLFQEVQHILYVLLVLVSVLVVDSAKTVFVVVAEDAHHM